MAFGTVQGARYGETWEALTTLVADDGTARQPHAAALLAQGAAARDLADAAHGLCLLHGRHPGLVELAADRATDPVAAAWLADAAHAFAAERATLVRIVADAGPLPSTPGQAETEAAIAGQRHALDMIAGSDRAGCPLGATMALMLDWQSIRRVLDGVADRLGMAVDPPRLPTTGDAATVVSALGLSPAFERAMLFGAQQMLSQHRALWQLLQARASARDRG